MSEKLQKVLASQGIGSRREMEKWISAGRIAVNDKTASLGDRVSASDKIAVDGRMLKRSADDVRRRVLIYNKPEGEVCTREDPEGRKTVFASLPPLTDSRWIAVGRLDINTSGLLLFSNDGELANRLMHPSSEIQREYLVRVRGEASPEILQKLQTGILLDDGLARFSKITIGQGGASNRWYSVVLTEGRNREVRRLWESQGLEVSRLKRVRFGSATLPSYVRRGDWIELETPVINQLLKLVDLKPQSVKPLSDADQRRRQRQEKRLRARGRR